jgi:ketosteroid isomerase-like protein
MRMVDANGHHELLERLGRLEGRVQELEDRWKIAECLHRYTRGLDRHNTEVLASAYHRDAIDRHGPHAFYDGPAEFVDWANALHEESWAAHLHFIDVNDIELSGDTARTVTYVFFTLRRKDGSSIDVGGGRYIDLLERRDGEWRIAVRDLVVEWTGNVPADWLVPDHPQGTWDDNDLSYRRPLENEGARP